MEYTREAVIDRLLRSYSSCYNIHLIEDDQVPITARCDFFEHSGKYVISKKAELWSADNEEFLYLVNIPHLTMELYQKWRDYIHEDGMNRIHVGPGHMASFHFSLHGWADHHTALIELSTGQIDANAGGRQTAKILKKVLYSKKSKGDR